MPPVELGRLTADEVRALPRDRCVFFLPVGPIEDHGPHLPLGLDVVEALTLSRELATKVESDMAGWKAVLLPALPLGIDSSTTDLALRIRPHVVRDWLVDACEGLARLGFVYFVSVTGQAGPKQLTALEEAGKILARRYRMRRWLGKLGRMTKLSDRATPTLVSAVSGTISWADVKRSPFWTDPPEHGAARDTSFALYSVPDQVAPSYSALPEVLRSPSGVERALKRWRRQSAGYWGSPSAANAEAGRAALREAIDRIYPKLRAVLEGAPPRSLFRSWYSVFPSNGSFFKVWVLFWGLFLLCAFWIHQWVLLLTGVGENL